MSEIVIEQPGVPEMVVPLVGAELSLGRADDNDVTLVADEVSRNHAKIVRAGDRYMVHDLNSLNGTYVNRQRVVQRILNHLDEVWLGGKCRMVFRQEVDIQTPLTPRTPITPLQETAPGTPPLGAQPRDPLATSPSTGGPPPLGAPLTPPDESAYAPTMIDNIAEISKQMEDMGATLSMFSRRDSTHIKSKGTPGTGGLPVEADDPQSHDTGMPTAEDLYQMGRAFRRLEALYQAIKTIASDFDLKKRLKNVLETTMEVVEAERGFIMLRDDETGELKPMVFHDMSGEVDGSSPSMSIAGRAATTGEPLLVKNTMSDSNFSAQQSIVAQQIRSAMCAPLRIEDRVLGSIYVDVRHKGGGFVEEDLELFSSMASQSAMAIENVRLYEQMLEAEKKRANLGRFLSPAIVDQIMSEGGELELGGTKRTVTTMFCDIRSFTNMSEQNEPDKIVDLLNEHFTAMTRIIFDRRGTLDKFIGDAIMAVWGSPISLPNDILNAVAAAIEMQRANDELNKLRIAEGRPPLDMGIGIASGEVIAGYVGSPDRMEFTVIGDRVNTASRFCSKAGPREIVICGQTHAAVKNQIPTTELGAVALKGKVEPEPAFGVNVD